MQLHPTQRIPVGRLAFEGDQFPSPPLRKLNQTELMTSRYLKTALTSLRVYFQTASSTRLIVRAIFCAAIVLLNSFNSLAATGPATSNKPANKSSKPNILLILTDDQGWSSLGCYGGNIVDTPHLDQLASEGAKFTSAYVTSQCTPTRATILTGQYTARNRMWHVIRWYGCPWARMSEAPFLEQLPRGTPTIASELQRAGYTTGIVGKWHLTNGQDGDYRGLRNEYSHHYGFDYAGPMLSDDEFEEGGDRGAATLTQQALGFIERNRDTPWFCFVSHHMIHGKVVAPESITREYRSQGFGDEGANRAVYLAGLKVIDNSVGELLQGLNKLGEERETVVIFLSDNGGIFERLEHRSLKQPHPDAPQLEPDLVEFSNAPLRNGKGSIYEGGVRVPFLVKWPGVVPPQTVVNTPVHAIDLAPTFFSMAGHSPSEELKLDGVDLTTAMQGNEIKTLVNRPIFQYCPFYDLNWSLTPCASIRKGKYKLIEFFGDRFTRDHRYVPSAAIELYDLESDISENNNLAEESPRVVAELKKELHSWMANLQVVASKPNSHHEPARAFETTSSKPDWMTQK